VGFVIAPALVAWVPALQVAGRLVAAVARQAKVLTLLLVGVGMSRSCVLGAMGVAAR
jgi:hypothetical protein